MDEVSEQRRADDPRTVLHWYDFRCPFCYIGLHRTAISSGTGLMSASCHSRLIPTFRPEGLQRDLATDRSMPCWRARPERRDCRLHWPPRLPDTRQALATAEWARRHQPRAFPLLHKDLFEAHFVLGEDLEDPAVIERHATNSGIDLAALRVALADGSATAAVTEAELIGRESGVRGTPAWLLSRQQRCATEDAHVRRS